MLVVRWKREVERRQNQNKTRFRPPEQPRRVRADQAAGV